MCNQKGAGLEVQNKSFGYISPKGYLLVISPKGSLFVIFTKRFVLHLNGFSIDHIIMGRTNFEKTPRKKFFDAFMLI